MVHAHMLSSKKSCKSLNFLAYLCLSLDSSFYNSSIETSAEPMIKGGLSKYLTNKKSLKNMALL